MPRRGYRKGLTDAKLALPHYARARVSDNEHAALLAEAHARAITISALVRRLISAHLTRQRAQLPHQDRLAPLLRELARIGNNLNQLTRQANAGLVPVSAEELRACLATINDLARRRE